MLRVIVLHKSVVWKSFVDERDKHCLKNVAVQLSIHNAIKDADLRGPMAADSGPNVDFERVLGLGLPFCRFTNLSVTIVLVLFKEDRTFVAENNIMESVATLHNLQSVFEPFNLVDVSDQLAISSALQGPSLLVPCSSNCGGVNHDSTLSQFLLNLSAGRLIVLSHLMLDERFCFHRKFRWPSRSVKVLCGSSVLNFFYGSCNACKAYF